MKAKTIIKWIFTIVAVALICMSGIMKLMQSDEFIAKMAKWGVAKYIIPLGLMEITFSVLFAFPKTLKIGFILLSCYFAGALAIELSYNTPKTSFFLLILIWVAAFLRDKSIFLNNIKKTDLNNVS